MTEKTSARKARAVVVALAGEYASLMGESQFKRGYRCGKGQAWWNTPESLDIEKREDQLWRIAQTRRVALDKALTAYARSIRREVKADGR